MQETDGYEYIPVEREDSVTLQQYIYEPSLSAPLRKKLMKYSAMYSNAISTGQIERWDIFSLMLAYWEICDLLDIGLWRDAYELIGEQLMIMEATKSIGGKGLELSLGSVIRSESIETELGKAKRKKSITGRIATALRGSKDTQEEI